MTAVLPTLAEVRAERVSPRIKQYRANKVRSGRALTARELVEVAALFPDLHGATNVGDLNSYEQKLLGVRGPSVYEQQQIDAAEDNWNPAPWNGARDASREEAQQRTARAAGVNQ